MKTVSNFFIFIGLSYGAQGPHNTNSAHEIDEPVESKSVHQIPSPRIFSTLSAVSPSGSSSTRRPKYMALFGGQRDDGMLLNDLHLFDTDYMHWQAGSRAMDGIRCNSKSTHSKCNSLGHSYDVLAKNERVLVQEREYENDRSTGVPPARRQHATCGCGSKLFIFGGWGYSRRPRYTHTANYTGLRHLNDLHYFDVDTMRWSGEIAVLGPRPSRRLGHTLTQIGDRCYLFGGTGPYRGAVSMQNSDAVQNLNDIHYFNCNPPNNQFAWVVPPAMSGSPPYARSSFTTIADGARLFIFGGEKGNPVHPNQAAAWLDLAGESSGNDGMPSRRFNDLAVFDTSNNQWLSFSVLGKKPATRARHSMVKCAASVSGNTSAFLFGGIDGLYHEQLDDIFILQGLSATAGPQWIGSKDPIVATRVQTQSATNQRFEPRPRTRFAHAIGAAGEMVYVFGGLVDGIITNEMDVYLCGGKHVPQFDWLARHPDAVQAKPPVLDDESDPVRELKVYKKYIRKPLCTSPDFTKPCPQAQQTLNSI